jgi:hypothetical protein
MFASNCAKVLLACHQEFSGFNFSFMENPLQLLVVGLMILGPAICFTFFLWYFRKTRLVFRSCITCPEKKQRANVWFLMRFGESGPHRDVDSCSLLDDQKKVTCGKACLLGHDILETPFAAARKQQEAG